MTEDMKKLYVSFTNLVHRMKSEEITPEALEDALFYFGCARVHLDNPVRQNLDVVRVFNLTTQKALDKGKSPYENEDLENAVRVYEAIKTAVAQAEIDGRATFRQLDQFTSFAQLNQLLQENGIDTSSVEHLGPMSYTYPAVREHYSGLVEVMTR